MTMSYKVVGVTRPIYELCMVLEKNRDEINFSVLYSFAEILTSHYYCPGFEFNLEYYEIQYDDFDRLQILLFPFKGYMGDEGQILTEEQIIELTENIRECYE